MVTQGRGGHGRRGARHEACSKPFITVIIPPARVPLLFAAHHSFQPFVHGDQQRLAGDEEPRRRQPRVTSPG